MSSQEARALADAYIQSCGNSFEQAIDRLGIFSWFLRGYYADYSKREELTVSAINVSLESKKALLAGFKASKISTITQVKEELQENQSCFDDAQVCVSTQETEKTVHAAPGRSSRRSGTGSDAASSFRATEILIAARSKVKKIKVAIHRRSLSSFYYQVASWRENSKRYKIQFSERRLGKERALQLAQETKIIEEDFFHRLSLIPRENFEERQAMVAEHRAGRAERRAALKAISGKNAGAKVSFYSKRQKYVARYGDKIIGTFSIVKIGCKSTARELASLCCRNFETLSNLKT